MKFSLALLFAAFLIENSVCGAANEQKVEKRTLAEAAVENEDSGNKKSPFKTPADDTRNNPSEVSPELQSQIALMENIKFKTVSLNPANLIPAILKTPEDQLIAALPTFHLLSELLEGTPLGVLVYNLEIVVTDSNPYLWHSVIESYPEFLGSITEVGGKLAGLANTEADQLAIFNEKEMGLTNLFPVADVLPKGDPFSQPEHEKTEFEEFDFDEVGQIAGALNELDGKKEDEN